MMIVCVLGNRLGIMLQRRDVKKMLERAEKQQIYLGFDFGMRHIGVAVGESITKTVTPLAIINAKNGKPNWRDVEAVVHKWQPVALIVGMPLAVDENEPELQTIAKKVEVFIEELKQHFSMPIYTINEALTTKAARELIHAEFGYKGLAKKPVDSVAAKIILETWMNSRGDE